MKRRINWFRVFMLISAACYYAAYLFSSELHVGETSVWFTYDNDWLLMAGLAFGAYLYSVINDWVQEKKNGRFLVHSFLSISIFFLRIFHSWYEPTNFHTMSWQTENTQEVYEHLNQPAVKYILNIPCPTEIYKDIKRFRLYNEKIKLGIWK